jgi:hypothetical protein
MYTVRPLDQGVEMMTNELFQVRDKAWKELEGRTCTAEVPSHAFCAPPGVKISYLGPTSMDLLKAKCKSVAVGTLNPPAQAIYDRMEKAANEDGIDWVSRQRSGAPYYAGPYANKQLANWMKRGQKELMMTQANSLYRTPRWQEQKAVFLDVIADEFDSALRILDLIQDRETAEYYVIGNKPETTGVGYAHLWRDRRALADAFVHDPESTKHILRHDLLVAKEGQLKLWDLWPFKSVEVSGFIGYQGSYHVSRSDVDVVGLRREGSRLTVELESMVRAANIGVASWASNANAIPRQEQQAKMRATTPAMYIPPMTKEVLRAVYKYPPITAPFACQADGVCIDADWGFSWPPPKVVGSDDNWTFTRPKELYKSGADAMIGFGSFTRGCTGVITPEWSSGRPATRRGYICLADRMISSWCTDNSVEIEAMSNGDDQAINAAVEDVPLIMNSELGPYLRTKGSDKNWTFRWGKTVRFLSPDELEVVTLPRIVKTVTTANALASGAITDDLLTLRMGEGKLYPLSLEACESAARTWEVAPDVFYMRGSPKDISDKLVSSSYQDALKDAIIRGAIDQNTSLYIGDVTDSMEKEMLEYDTM